MSCQQCVTGFLGAVRTGKTIDAHDALRTHELCELIVERIGQSRAKARES
ncbi:hypothetical protein [Kitasatospora sp. NPDC058190]